LGLFAELTPCGAGLRYAALARLPSRLPKGLCFMSAKSVKTPAKAAATPASQPAGPQGEIVQVHGHRIACDGVGGALGHPRVFLEMGDETFVECPYCDRRFVRAEQATTSQAPGVYEIGGGH
jgi:uncharacterized Zn-finger protein